MSGPILIFDPGADPREHSEAWAQLHGGGVNHIPPADSPAYQTWWAENFPGTRPPVDVHLTEVEQAELWALQALAEGEAARVYPADVPQAARIERLPSGPGMGCFSLAALAVALIALVNVATKFL